MINFYIFTLKPIKMKKLLVLSVILLFSCSVDEEPTNEIEQQYFIKISDECRGGTVTGYCISEAEFDKVVARIESFPAGVSIGCEWDVTFKDKNGVEHTGWVKAAGGGGDACKLNL